MRKFFVYCIVIFAALQTSYVCADQTQQDPVLIDFEDLQSRAIYYGYQEFDTSIARVSVGPMVQSPPIHNVYAYVSETNNAGGSGNEMRILGLNLDFDFNQSVDSTPKMLYFLRKLSAFFLLP